MGLFEIVISRNSVQKDLPFSLEKDPFLLSLPKSRCLSLTLNFYFYFILFDCLKNVSIPPPLPSCWRYLAIAVVVCPFDDGRWIFAALSKPDFTTQGTRACVENAVKVQRQRRQLKTRQ